MIHLNQTSIQLNSSFHNHHSKNNNLLLNRLKVHMLRSDWKVKYTTPHTFKGLIILLKSPKIPILLTKRFHTIILLKIRTQRIEERIVFDERQKYDSNSLINPNLNEKLIVQPKTNADSHNCFGFFFLQLFFYLFKGTWIWMPKRRSFSVFLFCIFSACNF